MKLFSFFVLCLILGVVAFSAGCSTPGEKTASPQTEIPTQSPPTNITYQNHGFSFMYPDNLVMTEHDTSGDKTALWDGEVHLKGESENTSISWMAMHHRPPDIPTVYESLRKSFQQDPGISDVKFYLLETYPTKTCGDATMIGHVSFYDKVRKLQTNEGIMLWYHPKQDRTYFIDMASGNDYKTSIRETLAGYQQSFRCADS